MFAPLYSYNISDEQKIKTVEYCDSTHWFYDKELVSVINEKGERKLIPFGGEILLGNALMLQDRKIGYRTIFSSATSYQKFETTNGWQLIPNTCFLSCFVYGRTCYAIIEGRLPHLMKETDSLYNFMKTILRDQNDIILEKGAVIFLDALRKK
jgi:hypothetical protein